MTRVAVEFEWQAAGAISLDGTRPAFPRLPDAPGLYRFTFEWPDRVPGIYIGETDGLRRRAQNYRTPGPTQRTNLRVNRELVEALQAGVRVSCAMVTAASISLDGAQPRQLDLARKTGRLILENASMAAAIAEREADPVSGSLLMNRPGVGEAEWA